jgi:hypothetical protein
MTIEIKKESKDTSQYTLIRQNKSVECSTFDTKTYLLHDICHYVVEKHLNYPKGFWGMLSAGHGFSELKGQDNPLTPELRFIEQIVGPVQAVFLGHFSAQLFTQMVQHIDFALPDDFVNTCLEDIGQIVGEWEKLSYGQKISLEF